MSNKPEEHTTELRGNVVVVCDEPRGKAHAVSDAVRDAIKDRGFGATVGVIEDLAPATITAADALIAGCWMPSKTQAGDEPMERVSSWIDTLPPLDGKPVGVYCAYRFFPHTFADTATRTAATEQLLMKRFERRGGKIAAHRAIHVNSIEEDTAALVDAVLELVEEPAG